MYRLTEGCGTREPRYSLDPDLPLPPAAMQYTAFRVHEATADVWVVSGPKLCTCRWSYRNEEVLPSLVAKRPTTQDVLRFRPLLSELAHYQDVCAYLFASEASVIAEVYHAPQPKGPILWHRARFHRHAPPAPHEQGSLAHVVRLAALYADAVWDATPPSSLTIAG